MHYFMTIYFNYCCYNSRYTLTKEFCERYPNVILIEIAYENRPFLFKNSFKYREPKFYGWATNVYINKFVKEHSDIESLTFIDSNLILEDMFFSDIEFCMDMNQDRPLYIQPYSVVDEKLGIMYDYKVNGSYGGHSGLCYSYNKKIIQGLQTADRRMY